MKLIAELAGERHQIDLRRNEPSDTRISAEIDERRYDLTIEPLAAGAYLLMAGDRVYECRFNSAQARRGILEVLIGSRVYTISVSDPRRLRSSDTQAEHAGGPLSLSAPMPGKVVRVLVEVGTEVAAGQGLIVVEAMKMQNEISAPRAGRIVEIHAAAGTTVGAGDQLITIE